MNHRIAQIVFGLGVGLLVATFAYRWIMDPATRAERDTQEAVVAASREWLVETLAIGRIEIVDALEPDRKVGKTYVFRADEGWEVSGYYRRSESDFWHPYLVTLDSAQSLVHLKISDPNLMGRASNPPTLEVLP